jgi:methyl-accepting chemotaxis protein
LNFLYFARGSIFETQYWVRRAVVRNLLPEMTGNKALSVLEELTAQLNTMIHQMRQLRNDVNSGSKKIKDSSSEYDFAHNMYQELTTETSGDVSADLF